MDHMRISGTEFLTWQIRVHFFYNSVVEFEEI